MRLIIILFIFLLSCAPPKEAGHNDNTDDNTITFWVFSIHKGSGGKNNTVALKNKTLSSGKIKDQGSATARFENYLSLYFCRNKTITDSLTIEHPLYRRMEYTDSLGRLSSKVAVLDSVEFFVRLQLRQQAGEIRFFEKTINEGKKELNSIKL